MKVTELEDTKSILSLPYSDRQLIVISDDELIAETKKKGRLAVQGKEGVRWGEIVSAAILDLVPLPFTRTLQVAAQEALRAWGKARDSGLKVLPVGKNEAEGISFPPGHPREGILYIGHPAMPHVYYTMADFHRVTFEHKFSEAIEVLMSLGATWIKVEHVQGWSNEFSSRISIPLADASVSAKGGTKTSSGRKLLYEANLPGVAASLPDDLVWYTHQPTWKSIALGRLKYGLTDFSMSVSYDDDFGINAGLKLSVAKTGLDVGGSFEDHVSTTWHLEGKFLPTSNISI